MLAPDAAAALLALAESFRECATNIERLARMFENAQVAAVPARQRDWPDVMTTADAARYCGYKTASAIRVAYLKGRLHPVGKRGGRGSWTWARLDLDEFMRGSSRPCPPVMAPTEAAVSPHRARPSRARTRARARTGEKLGAATEAALNRLRELRRAR